MSQVVFGSLCCRWTFNSFRRFWLYLTVCWRWVKVTIFDVKREWLCRPIEEMEPGTVKAGVTVCEAKQQRGLWGYKKGYTGCGYIEDTQTSSRSLDVVRLRWADASSWGFCVLPLERFLEGAASR